MKIVSLLPSATEIVYTLGLGDALVGVTEECDYPPEATTKPVVSRSSLPPGQQFGPGAIDGAVRELMGAGEPLYTLDRQLIAREKPDVILSQDLCRVCAVPTGEVQRALDEIGASDAKVVSLEPNTLGEVIEQIEVVGRLLDRQARAKEVTTGLRERVAKVKATAVRLPAIRTLALEWSDPPFAAGHWVPEMVEAVGAVNLLGEKGKPSRQISWREVADEMPEIVIFMPCGYYLEEAEDEAPALFAHPDFAGTSAAREKGVFAVDATSYFSRPGPRIIDGLEILAWAVHPDAYAAPPPGRITRILPG